MYMWSKKAAMAAILGLCAGAMALPASAQDLGLGRAATPDELAAWDIDVRADFKGLPKGSGTVDQGEELWEATCAVCHGTFAESNAFFTPLIGGTTAEDIDTGRVASLTSPTQSVRTTIMKATNVSTLWDYINRAMPWDNPKSLTHDEVYAALAYLLNLADIVDFDFTLSDETIVDIQDKMPNRNGAIFWEGLWRVDGEPDTNNTACMTDCMDAVDVSSELPEYARDANGDYAAQMRIVGPVRGVNAFKPALTGTAQENEAAVREHARATLDARLAAPVASEATDTSAEGIEIMAMLNDNGCMACHAIDTKVLGPSFLDIAAKYKDQDVHDKLVNKVIAGGSGVWGAIPMPPHPSMSEDDVGKMVDWILKGAPQ